MDCTALIVKANELITMATPFDPSTGTVTTMTPEDVVAICAKVHELVVIAGS